MIDPRQTKEYAEYMNHIGWKTERIDNVNYFIRSLPLFGSVLKIQRPEILLDEQIRKLEKKYRVFQTIIEPKKDLDIQTVTKLGFKNNSTPYLPTKTIHIDLTKNEEWLLKSMHYKTRYNIKVARKNKVVVETSKDIEAFSKLWQSEAKERGFFISQEKEIQEIYKAFTKGSSTSKAFGENAHILMAKHHDVIMGGVLLLFTKESCYYMFAFSTKEGKKYFAPTLLVWEALQIAKVRKMKVFDFEGIFDERFPLPRWKGFSRFKMSFGGKEIEYPGAFVRWRFPL